MGFAFISYSTKNQTEADAIRNLLNKKGIETWMAPGNIPAGQNYAGVINKALKECSCFVLVLSAAAQESDWVRRELDRAISFRKTIIPIQIENVVLNDAFDFYLSSTQLTAINRIDENSADIKSILASITYCTGQNTIAGNNNADFTINTTAQDTEISGNPVREADPAINDKGKGRKFIKWLPGFQKGIRHREIIASIYYILSFLCALSYYIPPTTSDNVPTDTIDALSFCFFMLSVLWVPVLVIGNIADWQGRIKFVASKPLAVRVLISILVTVLILCICFSFAILSVLAFSG